MELGEESEQGPALGGGGGGGGEGGGGGWSPLSLLGLLLHRDQQRSNDAYCVQHTQDQPPGTGVEAS